ncbi:putative membrane protein [Crossiella equi]|uniref:Membrane protein n=1 Tax=Crossiella equi TaxID=130796 RepID=A0ABS5A9S9_9PSEU|nr:vitamin K epoxide reductase family protein [Crossiella equi]MBP2473343.1 putative membrane protein [Crossiella equi]
MTSSDVVEDTAVEPEHEGLRLSRSTAWLLAVGGLVGLLAAFVLTVEKFELLLNPNYIPSCTFNSVLSCGTVMETPQAALFGFPNPLLGIAGFGIVTAAGFGLLAGAAYRTWFWLGLQLGATLGVVFVHWLIFQSVYEIRALCPYCMVVWAVMIPIFVYTTLHNAERGSFGRPLTGLTRFAWLITFTWLALVVVFVFARFGSALLGA